MHLAVRTRTNVRSSYSQQWHSVLTVASRVLSPQSYLAITTCQLDII